MKGYNAAIREALGVDVTEARVVEEVMRVERPTLDALDRRAFNRLARESKATLDTLREVDPACAEWYASLAVGERR